MLTLPEQFKKHLTDPNHSEVLLIIRIDIGATGENILRFSQVGMKIFEPELDAEFFYDQKDLQIDKIEESINIDKRNHTISEMVCKFENGVDDQDVIEMLGPKRINKSFIGSRCEVYMIANKAPDSRRLDNAVLIYKGDATDLQYDIATDTFELTCQDTIASTLKDEIPYVGIYERFNSDKLSYQPMVYGKRSRVPLIKEYPPDTEGEFVLHADYREVQGYGLEGSQLHTCAEDPSINSMEHPLLIYTNEYARIPHTIPDAIGWWDAMATGSIADEAGGESLGTIPRLQYTFDETFKFESEYTDVLVDTGGLEWELQYRPANLWSNDLIMTFQAIRAVSPTIPFNLSQTSPATNKSLIFIKPDEGIQQDAAYVWHMPLSADAPFTPDTTLQNITISGLCDVSGDEGWDNTGGDTSSRIFTNSKANFMDNLPMSMYAWNPTRIKDFLHGAGYRMPVHRGRSSWTEDAARAIMTNIYGIYDTPTQDVNMSLWNNGPIENAIVRPIWYYHHGGSRAGFHYSPKPGPNTQGYTLIGIHVEKPGYISSEPYNDDLGIMSNYPVMGGKFEWYDILFTDVPDIIKEWFAYGKHYWCMNNGLFNGNQNYNSLNQDWGTGSYNWFQGSGSDYGYPATHIEDQMEDVYGEDYNWNTNPFGWFWEYWWTYPQMHSAQSHTMPLGYDGYTSDIQNWSSCRHPSNYDTWTNPGINDWNYYRWNTRFKVTPSQSQGYLTDVGSNNLSASSRGATYGPPQAPIRYDLYIFDAMGGGTMYMNQPQPISTQDFLDALSDGGEGIVLEEQTFESGYGGYSVDTGSGLTDIQQYQHKYQGFGDPTEMIMAANGHNSDNPDDGFVFFKTHKVWDEQDIEANRPVQTSSGWVTGVDEAGGVTLPSDWTNALVTYRNDHIPLTPFDPTNYNYPIEGENVYAYRRPPAYNNLNSVYSTLELDHIGDGVQYDDLTYFTLEDNATTRTIARITLDLEGSLIKAASDKKIKELFNITDEALEDGSQSIKNVINLMEGQISWKLYPAQDGQNAPSDDDDFVMKVGVCNRDDQKGFDVNTTPANAFNYGDLYGINLSDDENLANELSDWNYDNGAYNQMFIDVYVASNDACDVNVARLQWGNLFMKQFVIAENAHKSKYFADMRGRIVSDYNPLSLTSGLLLEDPSHIIADLSAELGVDQDDFDVLAFERMSYEHSNIKLGFAVTENTTLIDLFEDMCKSTMSIPYYKVSSGKYSVLTLKKYPTASDLNKTIEVSNVLSFSYKQSDYDNVATQFQIEYDWDYTTKDYKKKSSILNVTDLLPAYDENYYGKTNLRVIQSKFISGSAPSAHYLRDWYARYYCNVHLIIQFTLPISRGLEIEVGDTIAFDDEIGGKKAFGKRYNRFTATEDDLSFNGNDLLPNFTVYKILKSTDIIEIECIQNHALSYQEYNPYNLPVYTDEEFAIGEWQDPVLPEPEGDYTLETLQEFDAQYGVQWRLNFPDNGSDAFFVDHCLARWNDGSFVLYPVQTATGGDYSTIFGIGDVNKDGDLNVLDVIQSVNFILLGADPGDLAVLLDSNLDENLDVLDVIALIALINEI